MNHPITTLEQNKAVARKYEDGSHPFTYSDIEPYMQAPAVKWIVDDETVGLVDESTGGIIGYVHRSHIDRIVALLNAATLTPKDFVS